MEDFILVGQAHEDEPLRHAEVKAVSELLWARQRVRVEDDDTYMEDDMRCI